jgi:hypothetical protein
MSSSALNQSPALHRPKPMREGFVWLPKIPSSCISPQRRIRGNRFVTTPHEQFYSLADRLTWPVKHSSTNQIPIVHHLS